MAEIKTDNGVSARRICMEVKNISNATEEELGYLKAIFCAIELMAETDSHRHKLEIGNLAKCGHWIAENFTANVDYMGDQIISASTEIH